MKENKSYGKDIRVYFTTFILQLKMQEQFAADHLAFCKSIGLKGRILVADEGINGTVSGDYETTQNTWTTFTASQAWKTSGLRLTKKVNKPSRRCLFLQKEIVHLGLEDNDFDNDINPLGNNRCLLVSKEFKEALLDEDTVVP